MRKAFIPLFLILFAVQLCAPDAMAQGGYTMFGDVHVTGDHNEVVPQEVTLILRRVPGGEVGRQMVSSRGRYRFTNLKEGEYEIIVEVDGREIGRLTQLTVGPTLSNSPYGFQNDLDFHLKSASAGSPGVISVADVYDRPAATKSLFVKAEEAVGKKKLDEASTLLKRIVEADKGDFQAWTALGSIYFAEEKFGDAEQAYLQAIEVKPDSPRAQLNLGRLLSSQKKYEAAVEPLTKAVDLLPTSGDANMLLGECYLQLRKGSKAIPHLNEAARLGHPEAHLRLGWLYNAAGLKDKAAIEYEEYLKKKPDSPDKNKLKEYIKMNKKS